MGLPGNFSADPLPSREGVPQVTSPKKQHLYAVVLASRHQMSSWLWSGKRLLQEPAPEPVETEAAHHGGGHMSPQWQEGIGCL